MNKKETITGLSKNTEPILVYLICLLGFIFSFLKDEVDKEVRWVYNQAGAIFVVAAGLGVISSITVVPFVGWIVGVTAWMAEIALMVFAIIAIVKACNGEHYEIPLVSELAKAIWKTEEKPAKKAGKVKEVEVKKETKKSAKKED